MNRQWSFLNIVCSEILELISDLKLSLRHVNKEILVWITLLFSVNCFWMNFNAQKYVKVL